MLVMFLWVGLPILAMLLVTIYMYRKVRGMIACFLSECLEKKQKILSILICALLIIPAFRVNNIWFIILLHITAFLLVMDGIVLIAKKLHKVDFKSKRWQKVYKSGIVAVLLTAIVCGYGRYNMFHVIRTEYAIQTQKPIRAKGYKLVLLSDLHYGISLDNSGLQQVVDKINKENADLIILDGDIVDESTTLQQMQSAFHILGQAKSNYGIYYVYGNHDKNNYARVKNYTRETLATTIKKSGIHILEDNTALINQEIALIGRADRSDTAGNRKTISQLVKNLDQKQEWIVLDHQPCEYEKVEKAKVDLILSGHTHAGQIWPAGFFASLFHFDALNYGEKKQESLNAIVTSGIAGWGYPMRTERHSEYVVINMVSHPQQDDN